MYAKWIVVPLNAVQICCWCRRRCGPVAIRPGSTLHHNNDKVFLLCVIAARVNKNWCTRIYWLASFAAKYEEYSSHTHTHSTCPITVYAPVPEPEHSNATDKTTKNGSRNEWFRILATAVAVMAIFFALFSCLNGGCVKHISEACIHCSTRSA